MNQNSFNKENIEYKLSVSNNLNSNFIVKNKKLFFKAFFIDQLHTAIKELFSDLSFTKSKNDSYMECCAVDSKVIQMIIKAIIETEEYTLEGIAYYTRIPFDVVFDAACGNSSQISITFWKKMIGLLIQIRPQIEQMLYENALVLKEKQKFSLLSILADDKVNL